MEFNVNVVLFTIKDDELKVLLTSKTKIYELPGGKVRDTESLEDTARRELFEKTGLNQVYFEQLYTFDDLKNNKIIITYFALINSVNAKLYSDFHPEWFSIKKLPELILNHEGIINYALKRLRYKIEYTSVGLKLLPKYFTITELRKAYEAILGEELDKRNFNKKIESMNIIEKTDKIKEGIHRPAALYSFKESKQKSRFKRVTFEK